MASTRIGIIGSGVVGQALARGFIGRGDDVKIGTREPQKLADWVAKSGEHASAGSFDETARFGEIVVLATLGTGTESALQLAGPENMAGKVVIDTTNPLDFSSGKPRLFAGLNDSLGERVQRLLPQARVVKAFNTVGNAHMVKPDFPDGPPDMFIAGNDDDAKKTVAGICSDFGWGVVDAGAIEASRYLEPLCMLWVEYGIRTGTWNHAFKLLRK